MLKRILIAALWLPLIALAQSYPSPTFNNVTSQGTATLNNVAISGTITSSGNIALSSLAPQAANTVIGNATASSSSPTAITVTGCNGAAQALQWTNAVGFGCNSSIATSGSNANITALTGLTTPLSIAQGGTGSGTQAGALSNVLGSSAIGVANGGTGRATLTSHAALIGAGTSGITQVAPSTAGQALISAGASADPTWGYPTGTLIGVQVFSSSGTYTPDAGTNSVIVEAVGAGGGGGGAATNGGNGGGGGSGAYAKVRFTSGFSGITVTIGAAGAGASAGANNGGTGGTTSFGALISCPGGGGGGGSANVNVADVTGGGAAGGTPTVSGGTTISTNSGTVGDQGWATANGELGGRGASSIPLGAGGNPTLVSGASSSTGGAGTGSGSGGGGGSSGSSGAAAAGGAGASGRVIVYEYN
jgi:hypothetical protein